MPGLEGSCAGGGGGPAGKVGGGEDGVQNTTNLYSIRGGSQEEFAKDTLKKVQKLCKEKKSGGEKESLLQ